MLESDVGGRDLGADWYVGCGADDHHVADVDAMGIRYAGMVGVGRGDIEAGD